MNKELAFITTPQGGKRRIKTTKGWQMCVQWKGGETSWVAMKDLKDSYPIELAQYVKLKQIDEEPAFIWWIPYVLKKKNAIISKLKSKYCKDLTNLAFVFQNL